MDPKAAAEAASAVMVGEAASALDKVVDWMVAWLAEEVKVEAVRAAAEVLAVVGMALGDLALEGVGGEEARQVAVVALAAIWVAEAITAS